MDTRLDLLAPGFKPLAMELLARCVEARIPIVIVNTLRTQAEQDAAIRSGHSWVHHSRHQEGLAMDICPIRQYEAHGSQKLLWDGADPLWASLGLIGERLGLRWGGHWVQRDLGHFEVGTP